MDLCRSCASTLAQYHAGCGVLRYLMMGISESLIAFPSEMSTLAAMDLTAYSYSWRFTYRSLPGEWAIV